MKIYDNHLHFMAIVLSKLFVVLYGPSSVVLALLVGCKTSRYSAANELVFARRVSGAFAHDVVARVTATSLWLWQPVFCACGILFCACGIFFCLALALAFAIARALPKAMP